MSKTLKINLLLAAIIVLGLFSLYNNWIEWNKMQKILQENDKAWSRYIEANQRIEKLESTLEWTQEELDRCMGDTMEASK